MTSDVRAALDAGDDGFHEIQLNGKQLVFLGMATTLVSVVIFLCGVLVGRGVKPLDTVAQAAGPQAFDAPATPMVPPGTVATPTPTPAPAPPPSASGAATRSGAAAAAPATTDAASGDTEPTPVGDSEDTPSPGRDTATAPAMALKSETPAPAPKSAAQAGSTKPAAPLKPAAPAASAVPPATKPAPPPPTETHAAASKPVQPEIRDAAKPVAAPAQASAVPAAVAGTAGGKIAVQVGAFNTRREADALAHRLSGRGYAVYVMNPLGDGKNVYRVRVGNYATAEDAQRVSARLTQQEKLKPWITR